MMLVWVPRSSTKETALPLTIAGSLLLTAAAASLLAVVPVSIENDAGEVIEGKLSGFTATSLWLDQSGTPVEYRFDNLVLLRADKAVEASGTKFRVSLIGGSRIAAQEISLSNSELVVELRRQDRLSVPVKQVKAIRFRPPSVATDAEWLGFVDRESRGDTLVIRRPGDKLDPQQGIVTSITDGKLAFDLDGDVVQAPLERLEGVVFGGAPAVSEDARIQVTDIYGSTWAVTGIEPSSGEEPLRMRLSPTLVHPLPQDQIESIRFTMGYALLAEAQPAGTSLEAYVPTGVAPQLMEAFFGPARDGDADLLMVGGSSIEYRIEPGYRSLAGSVRRHERVARAGSVTVRIELDGQAVWEQTLSDSQPRGFELPVENSRRVAITIDSEDDGDMGDKVRISRPRLLK
jgi:hypothetical protein